MGILEKLFNTFTQAKNHNDINYEYPINKYSWEDKAYVAASNKYFSGMEKIEEDWSILYNLKCYTGPKADKFINECKQNIDDFFSWQRIAQKYNETSPPSVPAFKRLAMIYEKQERYEDAISICKDALLACAHRDGSKGGMKGRLARMLKKAGRIPTPEESALLNL